MGKFDDDGFPPEATVIRPQQFDKKVSKAAGLDWPALAGQEPPKRKWAINGWVGYGHTTLLVGSGGIGKTLIAQQIGSALALGQPFIEDIPEKHKVLMWACEDDHDELWRRQIDIAGHFKRGLEEFNDFTLIPRHGQDNALATSDFGKLLLTPLIGTLAEQANDLRADVVILDNVAQLYGAGENDRHAVTAFLNHLSGALGPRALLLLSHPSRAQGSEFSGSGAWENVARTRLYLGAELPGQKPNADEPTDQDDRYLCRRKSNYSVKDYRKLHYESGVLVPEMAQEAGGLIGALREQHADKVVLEAVQKLTGMGITSNEGVRSDGYLPKLIMQYRLCNGQTQPEIASAMRRLQSDGKLTKGVVGKNQNRTNKMGFIIAS